MSEMSAFGNTATTAIFSVIISVAILILIGLAFFSYKHSFRSMFGVYDPIFRTTTRHTYMLETDMSARLFQPYVFYQGTSYYIFGNQMIHMRTTRAQKIETLTNSQLAEFFPLKSYTAWLNGGKEEAQNNNIGKLGYREHFESVEDVSRNANKNNVEMTSELTSEPSATKARIEMSTVNMVMEEQDITDMLPDKLDYTIAAATIPSQQDQEPAESAEKHFTSGICAICLDSLEDDDSVRGLMCGHVFHQICIDPWLTTRRACCPTCKRDLYIEIQNSSEASAEDANVETVDDNANEVSSVRQNRFTFNLNDIINLPTGEPGEAGIDELFNIDPDNCYSFFLILILTRLKAQILLTALLYVRNNNYSLEDANYDEENESLDNNIELDIHPNSQLNAILYSDQITSRFFQKNDTDSFKTPPIPDLNELNPQIKRIVEHHPRPFYPTDLANLDYDAWKQTKKMTRGIKRFYFYVIGVSQLQLYYYNVLTIYDKNRRARLHVNDA
ncbi:hypothetical protein PICMEDRAFT_73347 [Pichia membranifaciens NRRL Y-2026]|uniref:RING-type domain-containing protein n=1 Tax=Pichia membranifaciens NRRL Y-2026 TaxID=763406 RepID=A0A1E3NKJ4_9ASCO|nr:hypothetical protein PICMEDRAFT_73347 [Pichia membranifaciens NRRL Y-2026]ODQ45853.1 hypothetical protein PICMEDRAFT_73347 [Pichia membranifaciens NRRL Y-2026]